MVAATKTTAGVKSAATMAAMTTTTGNSGLRNNINDCSEETSRAGHILNLFETFKKTAASVIMVMMTVARAALTTRVRKAAVMTTVLTAATTMLSFMDSQSQLDIVIWYYSEIPMNLFQAPILLL